MFPGFLFSVLLLFTSPLAYAGKDVIAVTETDPVPTGFEYAKDPGGNLAVEDMIKAPDRHWHKATAGSATLGITSSTYWLRFSVVNQSFGPVDLVAELAYAQLDNVTFYLLSGNQMQKKLRTGDALPFRQREINHPNPMMKFAVAPAESKTIYIRVETSGSMTLPLRIWRESRFFSAASTAEKLHFFYYGSLTVIVLINFGIFFKLRETLYLYYALTIAGYLLFFASVQGYSFQILYPDSPALHARASLISMPVLALFSLLFCLKFLNISQHSPGLNLAMRGMVYFEIVNLACALLLSYNLALILTGISALIFFLLMLVAGPVTWKAGYRAGAFLRLRGHRLPWACWQRPVGGWAFSRRTLSPAMPCRSAAAWKHSPSPWRWRIVYTVSGNTRFRPRQTVCNRKRTATKPRIGWQRQ